MLDSKGLEHGVGGAGAGGGRRRGFGAAMGSVPGGSVDGQRNLFLAPCMHFTSLLTYSTSLCGQRNLFLALCTLLLYSLSLL